MITQRRVPSVDPLGTQCVNTTITKRGSYVANEKHLLLFSLCGHIMGISKKV